MIRALDQFDTLLRAIETFLVYIAIATTIVIVLLMVGDVGARYLFNSPLPRTYEIVNYYLMPIGLAFAFPICHRHREHIRIELFRVRVGEKAGLALDRLSVAASLIAVGAIGYYGIEPVFEGLRSGESIPGTGWPMWPAYATIPIAFGVLFAAILVELLKSLLGAPMVTHAAEDAVIEGYE